MQRLLGVAQGFVIRQLEDEAGLSVAAAREGRSYLELRMRLLELLDATPDSITAREIIGYCGKYARRLVQVYASRPKSVECVTHHVCRRHD